MPSELADLLGVDPTEGAAGRLTLETLQKRTRNQLLAAAKSLRLVGASKLTKRALAERVLRALEAPRREAKLPAPTGAPARPSPPAVAEPAPPQPATRPRLDLGLARRAEEPVADIPWSYGVDRITAAALDPDKLYVYWEVTDPAIERARAALGPGGPGAWLDLRVYDTTGRIFDGTNANSTFDQRIDRSDRQWFFRIGKPTSTAFVEVGMMSAEGFFAKIARSGRVDFPRKDPAPWSDPEWMTVRAAGGPPEHVGPGAPFRGQPAPGAPPRPFTPIPLWLLRQVPGDARLQELLEGWERVEWREVVGEGWFELQGQGEWVGPPVLTTWEAGPFAYPVEIEPPRRETWQGRTLAYTAGGVTYVVHGPWQVAIRNLGAHRDGALLGRWEIYRTWLASGGRELSLLAGLTVVPRPGASELVALGASERWWLFGSELRLAGASEVWRAGASEVLLRGASERVFAGASQWLRAGASERRFAGASERRLAGASERRLGGASERPGASERRLGASEHRLGASERQLDRPASSWPAPGAPRRPGK